MISVLWALFQIPSVQTYVAHKLTKHFSKELGTTISIDKFRIDFWNKVYLSDFYIEDKRGDTLGVFQNLELGINFFSWESREINCSVVFNDAVLKLSKEKGNKQFNHEFLIDYFSNEKNKKSLEWNIQIDQLTLLNSSFHLHDFNETEKQEEFDANHIEVSELDLSVEDIEYYQNHVFASIQQLNLKEGNGLKIEDMSASLKVDSSMIRLTNLNLQTEETELEANMEFIANSWEAFNNFNNEVFYQS